MKKLLFVVVLIVSTVSASPAYADPHNLDNFGQCQRLAIQWGVPHAEIRPPLTGGGPAVIFYDEQGNVIGINQPPAFFYGLACDLG